jgi:hypothetical protein
MREQKIKPKTKKLAEEKDFPFSTRKVKVSTQSSFGSLLDSYNFYSYKYKKLKVSPTQSLLQTWLRREHKIVVLLHFVIGPSKWNYWICDEKVGRILSSETLSIISDREDDFNTYENALEAGLVEALKLIKNGK